ncbi:MULTISPECIES: hypothetical protein [Kordiimonas]|jgi:hypothetical protein|uniref:hypothetical protein n=1 Tax=Kordiimonas TaxID=288021 RepID=UPI00257DD772|nr:hypothetical protein [Kordiimonas sp. UBA4487]
MSKVKNQVAHLGVLLVLRDAVGHISRIWARAVIVCLAMVCSLLAFGGILQLFGIPIFDVQPEPAWRFDTFLFNWLGWVISYIAYTMLIGKMLAHHSAIGAALPRHLLKSGMSVFVLMAVPSAIVSTWMPDGDLTMTYILAMVPQSMLDVSLSVCVLYLVLRRGAINGGEFPTPDWRSIPIRLSLALIVLLGVFLIAAELLYTALGTIKWQVLTGSDDLSAFMSMAAFAVAIMALYLNIVATPGLVAAWYSNQPGARDHLSGIRNIFG